MDKYRAEKSKIYHATYCVVDTTKEYHDINYEVAMCLSKDNAELIVKALTTLGDIDEGYYG